MLSNYVLQLRWAYYEPVNFITFFKAHQDLTLSVGGQLVAFVSLHIKLIAAKQASE